jgi:hypothetical protein
MFISGHIEIIKDLLDNHLPKDFFPLKTKKSIKDLFIGLEYPDAPCGKYKITSNNTILFKRAKLCELINFVKLFSSVHYGESKIFQFHKGYFAHLHSMSTDPENTVLKIRDKIINSIIGYALLAFYSNTIFNETRQMKPDFFWIGIILHMITDSYSPAHTIRDNNYTKIPNIEKDTDLIERLKIHEDIKSLAKEDKLYKKHEFKYKSKQFWKIYKAFKFEYNINKIIKKDFDFKTNKIYKEQNGDIQSFQYYDNQSLVMHAQYDLLSYVKDKKNMYKRMIHECKTLLILYKNAIETQDIHTFINDLVILLLNGTYRISKANLKNKTDTIAN